MESPRHNDVFIPYVRLMDGLSLGDDVPRLQSTPATVAYEIAQNNGILDCTDHVCYPSDFSADLLEISKIKKLVKRGEILVRILYSYRGVSKAIPAPARGSSKADIEALGVKSLDVLQPEMDKIKAVYEFQNEAISSFTDCVDKVVRQGKKKVVPESLFDALITLADLLQQLDRLKDGKSCLANDLSRYKRILNAVITAEHVSRTEGAALESNANILSNFISNIGGADKVSYPNRLICRSFRDALRTVPSSDDMLSRLLQHSVDRLVAESFFTPTEKHRLLRSLPLFIWLADADDSTPGAGDGFNAFKQKRVKMTPVQRFIQRYAIVPEMGDIFAPLAHTLVGAPHLTPEVSAQFSSSSDARVIEEASLPFQRTRTTEEYANFVTEFSSMLVSPSSSTPRGLTTIVLKGLHLLEKWTSTLLEAHAAKLANPFNEAAVISSVGTEADVNQYARAVRYNYSQKELTAVAEMVTAIKSLAAILNDAEPSLAPAIRTYIHACTQQLVQGDMLPILHRADKKKRGVLVQLLSVRSLLADWTNDNESKNDYRDYKRKEGRISASFPTRVAAPSTSQLQLARSVVRAICDESSELRQGSGIRGKEDLTKDDIEAMMEFYRESFVFPYLLDLRGTVRACSDLGDLWFREYHLEITQNIQFPLEQSFPWILTEHMVRSSGTAESSDPSDPGASSEYNPHGGSIAPGVSAVIPIAAVETGVGMVPTLPTRRKKKKGPEGGGAALAEAVMYVLDIYNDAAQRALYDFRSQHLFDEVQAELGVAHAQLVFQLESEVYGHCKDWAASTTLDKLFRQRAEERRGWGRYTPAFRKHTALVQQRHALLLGRNVDFSRRFTMDLGIKLNEDLDLAMARFEGGGLSKILEFEISVKAIMGTHRMLQRIGLSALDPIEDFLSDVLTRDGRLAAHVLRALVMDLFPKCRLCLNTGRWVRSIGETTGGTLKGNHSAGIGDNNLGGGRLCGKAYEQVSSLTSEFVGDPHIACILRMLSSSELTSVIEGVLQYVEAKLDDILDWARALTPGIPTLSLPPLSAGLTAVFSSIEADLKALLDYPDLDDGLFQDFREVGNALMFLSSLGKLMQVQDSLTFVHALPVVGVPTSRTWEADRTRAVNAIETATRALTEVEGVSESVAQVGASLVGSIRSGLEATAACSHTQSLFGTALQRLDTTITASGVREEWEGNMLDGIKEFSGNSPIYHRFWSAIHFAFCQPFASSETSTNHWIRHGDGVAICGASLLLLLGQQDCHNQYDVGLNLLRTDIYERGSAVTGIDSRGRSQAEAFLWYAKQQRSVQQWVFSAGSAVFTRDSNISSSTITFHPPPSDEAVSESTWARNTPSPITSRGGIDSLTIMAGMGGLFSDLDSSGKKLSNTASVRMTSSPTDSVTAVPEASPVRRNSFTTESEPNNKPWPSPITDYSQSRRPPPPNSGAPKPDLPGSVLGRSMSSKMSNSPLVSPVSQPKFDHGSVSSLSEIFSQVPESEIVEILEQSGGDLKVAASVLADRSHTKSPSRNSIETHGLKPQRTVEHSRGSSSSVFDSTPIDVLIPMTSTSHMNSFSNHGVKPTYGDSNYKASLISDLDPEKVAKYEMLEYVDIPPVSSARTQNRRLSIPPSSQPPIVSNSALNNSMGRRSSMPSVFSMEDQSPQQFSPIVNSHFQSSAPPSSARSIVNLPTNAVQVEPRPVVVAPPMQVPVLRASASVGVSRPPPPRNAAPVGGVYSIPQMPHASDGKILTEGGSTLKMGGNTGSLGQSQGVKSGAPVNQQQPGMRNMGPQSQPIIQKSQSIQSRQPQIQKAVSQSEPSMQQRPQMQNSMPQNSMSQSEASIQPRQSNPSNIIQQSTHSSMHQPAPNTQPSMFNMQQSAHNMSQPMHNMQQPMFNMSQPIHNVSQQTNNMSQLTHNMTQPIHNMTQPTHNMTQPTHNMPQPTHNMPQPTHNMPQPMHNMQQAPHNMSQSTHNMSQSIYNMNAPQQLMNHRSAAPNLQPHPTHMPIQPSAQNSQQYRMPMQQSAHSTSSIHQRKFSQPSSSQHNGHLDSALQSQSLHGSMLNVQAMPSMNRSHSVHIQNVNGQQQYYSTSIAQARGPQHVASNPSSVISAMDSLVSPTSGWSNVPPQQGLSGTRHQSMMVANPQYMQYSQQVPPGQMNTVQYNQQQQQRTALQNQQQNAYWGLQNQGQQPPR